MEKTCDFPPNKNMMGDMCSDDSSGDMKQGDPQNCDLRDIGDNLEGEQIVRLPKNFRKNFTKYGNHQPKLLQVSQLVPNSTKRVTQEI